MDIKTVAATSSDQPTMVEDQPSVAILELSTPVANTSEPPATVILDMGTEQAIDIPYTILTEHEKIFTVIIVSFAALVSPMSSSMYYPALNSLAASLHVNPATINLTITVYMICQGLGPTFFGTLSDHYGRRPAYLMCFVIYIGANIGLALQSSYSALVVLRCLQSTGASSTVTLASASVADIITRAERGKFMGYASMGVTLGPSLGPVIGGILDHFLGWRSIFWFLTIMCSVLLVVLVVYFPETSRSVVGNGSIAPQRWNTTIHDVLRLRERRKLNVGLIEEPRSLTPRKRRPSPWDAIRIAGNKEDGIILLCGSLLYAGFFGILSSLPSRLQAEYNFNSLQVGLCYIPYGTGSLTSRWTSGSLLDWNFRRHARKRGIPIIKNRQQQLRHFPIEHARLEVILPFVLAAAFSMLAYGWVMNYHANLAGPLIMLFFTAHFGTGAVSGLGTIIVDINIKSPGTAVAANQLCRCIFAAGSVAAAVPVIDRIGMGWTGTCIAGIWVACSPMLWAIMKWGEKWREEKEAMSEREENHESRPEVQT